MAVVTGGLTPSAGAQEPTGFLNHTVTVDGVSHRYQVYVPAEYSRARRWPVILLLHGSGERGTDGLLQTAVGLGEGIRRHAGRWPAIVVFPQAPLEHRWHGKVAHLARGPRGDPAARQRSALPVIAGRIPSHPTWIWPGDADGLVRVEESRRMAEALGAVGAEVTYTELPGVGHDAWTPAFDSPELPRWLLRQTRRAR